MYKLGGNCQKKKIRKKAYSNNNNVSNNVPQKARLVLKELDIIIIITLFINFGHMVEYLKKFFSL